MFSKQFLNADAACGSVRSPQSLPSFPPHNGGRQTEISGCPVPKIHRVRPCKEPEETSEMCTTC